MKSIFTFLLILCFSIVYTAQDIIPLIEVQGETDVSPYNTQEVTINAKVTASWGDYWFMQDEFGPWNGLFFSDTTVLCPPNPPWWTEARPPEVGDELTLTGTIQEILGNTVMTNITLVEQTEFWLATAAGTQVTAAESQVESLEGTKVRLLNMDVLTEPNEFGEWTITDGTETLSCFGIDDEDYPTPGDVYDVFGAMLEKDGVYWVYVDDIDVISLGINEFNHVRVDIYPNPMNESTLISSDKAILSIQLYDMSGRMVQNELVNSNQYRLNKNDLKFGIYNLLLEFEGFKINRLINIQY